MMRRAFRVSLICCCLLGACKTPQTNSSSPTSTNAAASLDGTWELNYISGIRIAFDGLYPEKKPVIAFDAANNQFSGNTSCNSYRGKLNVDGNKINFAEPIAMTKMMCPGQGETTFVETLKKVNTYSISGDSTLNLLMGDVAIMRFVRK